MPFAHHFDGFPIIDAAEHFPAGPGDVKAAAKVEAATADFLGKRGADASYRLSLGR